MKTKNIIITAGLVIAGIAVLGYKKVNELQATFDKMTLFPVGIRNVKVGIFNSTCKIDVAFKNPTNLDFAVNGVVATLRKIIINYKGQPFGMAEVNIDSISVPAYQTLTIKDLPVIISNATVIQNLTNLTNISMNDLQITAVVDVMGNEFTLTQ